MVSLSEILKLDIRYKSIVVGTLLLMPFYYVAFYLLNKPFITDNTLVTIVIFCFCLSFVWFIVTFTFGKLADFAARFSKYPIPSNEEADSYYNIMQSVLILCVFIIPAYVLKRPFFNFLITSYICAFLIFSFRLLPLIKIFKRLKRDYINEIENSNQQ